MKEEPPSIYGGECQTKYKLPDGQEVQAENNLTG